jgi:hypothetical protein
MLAMIKQFAVSLAELRFVSIGCACGTKVVIDLSRSTQFAKNLGQECPGCGRAYDSCVGKGINSLQSALGVLEPVKEFVSFQVDS